MKISLKNLNLKEVEKLTREQLKDVLGGQTQQTTGIGVVDCQCGDGRGTVLACDELDYESCLSLCSSFCNP